MFKLIGQITTVVLACKILSRLSVIYLAEASDSDEVRDSYAAFRNEGYALQRMKLDRKRSYIYLKETLSNA